MKNTFAVFSLLLSMASVSAQEWAKAALERSPRHHEWVKVTQGNRQVECFLTFPEVSDKAAAVVVIHENRGLTDWVRSVADQLAEAGYVAIAPDFLSGMAPDGGKTTAFSGQDAATRAIYALPPDQVTADLRAVVDHVSKLPACNGKVAVAGFCWGGTQTFRFATDSKDIKAAFVFYGTAPSDAEAIAKIECPVYGFYGGNDARVNATIPKTRELMKSAGRQFEPVTYEGAGHGFMRSAEEPSGREADKKARTDAWERWRALLRKL